MKIVAKEQSGNFEAQLFKVADKLQYISESFQTHYDKPVQDAFSDPEDSDECRDLKNNWQKLGFKYEG